MHDAEAYGFQLARLFHQGMDLLSIRLLVEDSVCIPKIEATVFDPNLQWQLHARVGVNQTVVGPENIGEILCMPSLIR